MTKHTVKQGNKEYVYKNQNTVMITREIDKEIANACKKLSEKSNPKIPLNYMVEEGLRMFLKKHGVEV